MIKKSVFVLSTLVFSGLCAASAAPVDSSEQPKVLLVLSPASPLVKKIVNSGMLKKVNHSQDRAGGEHYTLAAAIKDPSAGVPADQSWIVCSYSNYLDYDGMSRAPNLITSYEGCTVYQGSFADKYKYSLVSFEDLKTLTVVDVLNLAGEAVQSSAAE